MLNSWAARCAARFGRSRLRVRVLQRLAGWTAGISSPETGPGGGLGPPARPMSGIRVCRGSRRPSAAGPGLAATDRATSNFWFWKSLVGTQPGSVPATTGTQLDWAIAVTAVTRMMTGAPAAGQAPQLGLHGQSPAN